VKADDPHVQAVGDFILAAACCAPCQNAARRNRGELDEVIVAALSVEREPNPLAQITETVGFYGDGRNTFQAPPRNEAARGFAAGIVAANREIREIHAEPSRVERTFHVLAVAALLVAGIIIDRVWILLVRWVGL